MRFLFRAIVAQVLALFLASIVQRCWAADAYATNKTVTLSGVVRTAEFADANDRAEEAVLLDLDAPIDVSADEFDGPARQVTTIQLVLYRGRGKSLVGKRVRAVGSLFYANTAHHHTNVLLQVDKVQVVKRVKAKAQGPDRKSPTESSAVKENEGTAQR